MKRQSNLLTIIVTVVMLITAIISLLFLPSEIAVQWNESGVSNTGSKFFILIFSVFSAIFLVLRNEKVKETAAKNDFVSLLVSLVLFAAQNIITLNALEYINMMSLNYQFMQTIALLIVGLTICICGNYIPKFIKNFYYGVKASFAYADNDLWTKTQRFAGKIWFASGLIIMLLSFIQWKGISLVVLLIILCVIILPRIYSRMQFEKTHKAE